MDTLAVQQAGENFNTLGWHFSTHTRIDFIDICLKNYTEEILA